MARALTIRLFVEVESHWARPLPKLYLHAGDASCLLSIVQFYTLKTQPNARRGSAHYVQWLFLGTRLFSLRNTSVTLLSSKQRLVLRPSREDR